MQKVNLSTANSDIHIVEKNYNSLDPFEENLKYLISLYPDQVLFNIKEASKILRVSYEFVRKLIKKGIIKCTAFGKRKLIHISELAKLITQGAGNYVS